MTDRTNERKYARVYYSVIDDDKFVGIYTDDRHLAAWLRLLLTADAMWPASPPLPRTIRPASLQALVEAKIVDLMPSDCYRIHGLDAERSARAVRASNAAAVRWDSERNADALPRAPRAKPSLAEPSRAEIRPPETNGQYDAPETEAVAWLAHHGVSLSETNGLRRKLILLVERFGSTAVIGKFDRLTHAGIIDGDASGFVFGAEDALFPKADMKALDREDRAADERRASDARYRATQAEIARMRGEAAP